ncbi:MAG TPA: hypothetical protein VHC22_14090 [Pirellulales bacterium]|nr:hypothetical protein [Pirellulales bacterium]
MRIDSLTGELIEQIGMHPGESVGTADASQAEGEAEVDPSSEPPRITPAPGEFARRLAEIELASADWPNDADDRRPLSCVGEFLCEELRQHDAQSERGYAALRKLLAGGLIEPVDGLIAQFFRPSTEGFVIPCDYTNFRFNSFDELIAGAPWLAKHYGMRAGNGLFAGEGWLNTLWQKGILLLADRRVEAADDLSRQPADDRGALCALLSAEILHAAGFDSLSPVCARRGLRRTSLAAFQDDCRELLSGRGLASRSLLHVAASLRNLDAEEVKALTELLTRFELIDASQASVLEQCATALRADAADTPAQAATRALDVLWRAGISDWVEQRLNALVTPPPIAAPFAYGPGGAEGSPGYGSPGGGYGAAAANGVGVYAAAPDAVPTYVPSPTLASPGYGAIVGGYGAAAPDDNSGYVPAAPDGAPTYAPAPPKVPGNILENDGAERLRDLSYDDVKSAIYTAESFDRYKGYSFDRSPLAEETEGPENETMPVVEDRNESLREEVRLLKEMALVVADRLQMLENRMSRGADWDPDLGATGPPLPADPKALPVEMSGPTGVHALFNWRVGVPEQVPLPITIPISAGNLSQFKIAGIAGHKRETLNVWLHLPVLDKPEELAGQKIPLVLRQDDLLAALAGRNVVTVVYLAEVDGEKKIATMTAMETWPAATEAFDRGTLLAVAYINTNELPPPPSEVVPPTVRRRPTDGAKGDLR